MRRKVVLAVTALLIGLEAFVVIRRRGSVLGARTVVRCLRGHLFSTLWIPGVSLKAFRLGWWRVQRCPEGPHWSLVTPAKMSELTEEERQAAEQRRDVAIP